LFFFKEAYNLSDENSYEKWGQEKRILNSVATTLGVKTRYRATAGKEGSCLLWDGGERKSRTGSKKIVIPSPVFLANLRDRTVQGRRDKKPRIADLRASGTPKEKIEVGQQRKTERGRASSANES